MVFNRSNAVARRGIIAALLTVSACGDNPVEPLPEVASIIVSSPIDTVFARGGSASLVATAKTATGDPKGSGDNPTNRVPSANPAYPAPAEPNATGATRP